MNENPQLLNAILFMCSIALSYVLLCVCVFVCASLSCALFIRSRSLSLPPSIFGFFGCPVHVMFHCEQIFMNAQISLNVDRNYFGFLCVVTAELQHMFIVVAGRCCRCHHCRCRCRCPLSLRLSIILTDFFFVFASLLPFFVAAFVSVRLRFSCRWLLSNCDFDSVRQAVVDTIQKKRIKEKEQERERERSDLRIKSKRRMWTNGLKWKKIEMRQEIRSKCVSASCRNWRDKRPAIISSSFFPLECVHSVLHSVQKKNARAKTDDWRYIHTKH